MNELKQVVKECIEEEKKSIGKEISNGLVWILAAMFAYQFIEWLFS